jgi:hypothetical protein
MQQVEMEASELWDQFQRYHTALLTLQFLIGTGELLNDRLASLLLA